MTPPTLTVTIEQIDKEQNRYRAVISRADTKAEIFTNSFTFNPDLLIDMEPQWMLDKAVPRHIDDALRGNQTPTEYAEEQAQKLAGYGQRLYGFLFGDGTELQSFLKYNDAYAQSAHLTLALHSSAAILWRLPWEYIHDGSDFLALHGKFQLSRRPYELGKLTRDPVQLPLRVLVIVSSPEDQAELNTEKELSAIQQALDEAQRQSLIQTEYLEDATLEAIGDALKSFNPHVLHYTGHGAYREDKETPANSRSFLALEKENGKMQAAGIAELRPHLQNAPDLRLAVLSGCQTAQTSGSNAFSGVATGMLAANIPAVVAMQFSILDSSGIHLARAFYTALALGDTLSAAMQATRIALWQFDEGPGYDWGIPALYLRTEGMVMVDKSQVGAFRETPSLSNNTLINIGGLPLPRHFVGRKTQLRQLRHALRDNQTKSAFIRGMGGMGKSSLVAKLAQRPGTELDGVLVIRCHEVDVLDIPGKLASFLQSQGIAGHADAGNMLLNPTLDPAERAQRAADLVGNRRYLIVFDNFESVMATDRRDPDATHLVGASHLTDDVADDNLRGLLRGLLTANWRSLCLFTGRYRWQAYEEVVVQEIGVEIHLPELTAQQTLMLMNNLSRLRQEKRAVKVAIYRKVGGHPKTIELLNGWLKDGSVSDLLADPQLDDLLTSQWEDYFLQRLLAKLTAEEQAALTRLSIFQTKLGEDELAYASVDEAMVRHWLDLSLLQRERGETAPLPPQLAALLHMLPPAEQAKLQAPDRYMVHPVVTEYLLAQMAPVERQALHRWAAAFYGKPFVDIARNYAAQSGENWMDEQIEALASSDRGIVRQMVKQTQDIDFARDAMAQALAWQGHLFAAGEVNAAGDIVIAVQSILVRWGEIDRVKGLLRRNIASQEGSRKAIAQGNLANLFKTGGELVEALTIYHEIYETFAAIDAKQQMAFSLGQMGSVYKSMGKLDEAIEKYEQARFLSKECDDEEGQAIGLHQLAMLYRLKEEYEMALANSQQAEMLARKLNLEEGVAKCLHEQAIIYDEMSWESETDEEKMKYMEMVNSCFQDSLAINRRIGNEL